LQNDTALLKAVLMVYGWLCPGRARELPSSVWQKLGLRAPGPASQIMHRQRVRYLDSRAWFAALQAKSKKLEV
jgi:hypothetical protein